MADSSWIRTPSVFPGRIAAHPRSRPAELRRSDLSECGRGLVLLGARDLQRFASMVLLFAEARVLGVRQRKALKGG